MAEYEYEHEYRAGLSTSTKHWLLEHFRSIRSENRNFKKRQRGWVRGKSVDGVGNEVFIFRSELWLHIASRSNSLRCWKRLER